MERELYLLNYFFYLRTKNASRFSDRLGILMIFRNCHIFNSKRANKCVRQQCINILRSVLLLKYDPKSVIMGYNSKYAANALALVTKAAIALECMVAMQTLLITFINLPNADQIYFVHRLQWRLSRTCHQFQL